MFRGTSLFIQTKTVSRTNTCFNHMVGGIFRNLYLPMNINEPKEIMPRTCNFRNICYNLILAMLIVCKQPQNDALPSSSSGPSTISSNDLAKLFERNSFLFVYSVEQTHGIKTEDCNLGTIRRQRKTLTKRRFFVERSYCRRRS